MDGGRPVVAGGDDVHRQPAQGFAQQLGGVFLDDVAQVVEVVEEAVLSLAQIVVLLDAIN